MQEDANCIKPMYTFLEKKKERERERPDIVKISMIQIGKHYEVEIKEVEMTE